MKIESVRIENFRVFRDETIFFDNYTCFVGANGAGKSTVFNALNIFFRQYKDSKTDLSKLSADDFHHKDVTKDIKITVTFSDLSQNAKENLATYVRQDKLIVTAVATYDANIERAEVKQYGNRLGMKDFKSFFEADKAGAKVSDLKAIYSDLQQSYTDLPNASTKADMIEKLQLYEAERKDLCELIPSEDQFYGISKGANRLAPYIQWIFIPASKDVTEEGEESKTSALGQLLARTVRTAVNFDEKVNELRLATRSSFQNLITQEQSALEGISSSLQTRLSSWAHPKITAQVLWKLDPDKSVKIEEPWAYIKIGERGFDGDLSRFGHGLQRSYMLALLQELTSFGDSDAPTLIMAIEEPELYQHPPQARYLAETLIELAERESQVLLCTHSPLFIPGDNFQQVRIVRENGSPSFTTIKSVSYVDLSDELARVGARNFSATGMIAKLYPTLSAQLNEMFFCKVLILVEGIEDIAYINSYLFLTNKMIEFRKYGCHIVAANGKDKMINPLALAKLLSIPVFVIFDGDTDKSTQREIDQHKRDNKALIMLQNHSDNEWPEATIYKADLICWKSNLTATMKVEFGAEWQTYKDRVEAFYDNPGGLEKNPLAIGRLLELAWTNGVKSPILENLIERIINFARAE